MLKRQKLKDGNVVKFKLRENLFTLAQIRVNTLVQFFDFCSSTEELKKVDLRKTPTLFFAFAAIKRFDSLIVEVVDSDLVTPSDEPIQKEMLSAIIGSNGNHGAKLIRLSEDFSNIGGQILKEPLSIPTDLDIIYSRELVGTLGDPEKLRTRLARYFDTGVNWDESKEFLFKGISPPIPKKA